MSHVAVLAPHPDDEILGCASILLEHDAVVVHVTDGVPPSTTGDDATALRSARHQEAYAACEALGPRGAQIVALGFRDQELWSRIHEIADALVTLLSPLDCDAVFVPALQAGHPDHDGLYMAAQLARRALGSPRPGWSCYALYALDDHGAPSYGWLDPSLFPAVTERVFSAEELDRKSRALRAFATQVRPGSIVQRWLDAPADERFAPLPPLDAPIPRLRCYYDEILHFDEQGIDRVIVDRTLEAALTGPGNGAG